MTILYLEKNTVEKKIYILHFVFIAVTRASQVVLVVKNPPADEGDRRDQGLIPESRRSPGGENGNPL